MITFESLWGGTPTKSLLSYFTVFSVCGSLLVSDGNLAPLTAPLDMPLAVPLAVPLKVPLNVPPYSAPPPQKVLRSAVRAPICQIVPVSRVYPPPKNNEVSGAL